jgi:hypothetical protein
MKLQEQVKPTKARKMIMILNENQFQTLAQNVLNEQKQKTIKKTYLIKQESDATKK